MNQPGKEYVLLASNLTQARIIFRFVRAMVPGSTDKKLFRWTDSTQRIGCLHLPSLTRLNVISSKATGAFGLVDVPLVVAEEAGTWETRGGDLMAQALDTSLGKPGSPMRILYIGTLSPARSGWWIDLVNRGTYGTKYIQTLQGRLSRWDQWSEIRRVNPLTAVSEPFRKKLLSERDDARQDSRLRAQFCSYRLNLPTQDEATTLLTVDDYELMIRRPTPEREGQPLVSIDLGQNRSWSAATAIWRTGRVEALATCPGIPDIEGLEKRDRVPSGTYRSLVTAGLVTPADGLRVQPPSLLWERIQATWGTPVNIIGDFFRLDEMADSVRNVTGLETRRTRWSESSKDIRALRQLVKDGPLVVAEDSRPLVRASLSVSMVENDDSGNVRLLKRGVNNESRDDVAAALVLAAGAFQRANQQVADRELAYAVV